MEPRHTTVGRRFRLRRVGARCRFIKIGETQARVKERAHVGAHWTMVIQHADSPILDPHGVLLEIVIDRKTEVFASLSLHPTMPRCLETVEIRDQNSTAGTQYTGHLRDGRLHVRYVDQRQVANDKIEGIVVKWKTFSDSFEIRAGRIVCASGSKQRGRRIDACDPYAMRTEHAAKPALATAHIKGFSGRAREGAGQHHRIEYVAPSKIPEFTHVRNPSLRRCLPAIIHTKHRIPDA